jgi:hypothetical protein
MQLRQKSYLLMRRMAAIHVSRKITTACRNRHFFLLEFNIIASRNNKN